MINYCRSSTLGGGPSLGKWKECNETAPRAKKGFCPIFNGHFTFATSNPWLLPSKYAHSRPQNAMELRAHLPKSARPPPDCAHRPSVHRSVAFEFQCVLMRSPSTRLPQRCPMPEPTMTEPSDSRHCDAHAGAPSRPVADQESPEALLIDSSKLLLLEFQPKSPEREIPSRCHRAGGNRQQFCDGIVIQLAELHEQQDGTQLLRKTLDRCVQKGLLL